MKHRSVSDPANQAPAPSRSSAPVEVRNSAHQDGGEACRIRAGGASGQILVLVALAIIILMGFASMAIDVGQFWSVRRNIQTAADASAVAGAIAHRLGNDATAAAKSASALNNFTDGTNGTTVTVNNPPKTGPYAGNTSYVEVVVASRNRPTSCACSASARSMSAPDRWEAR